MSTLQRIATLGLSLTALLMTGCSGSFSPGPTTATTTVGAIQGNVHGGQQPIYQAHVFLFAVGTGGDAGPGITASTSNKATSLISSSTPGSALDSTIGGYYVLTSASGSFTISGDYTCTLGTQVYALALQGKADGTNNNTAIGMMAVLGNCPGSGTLSTQVPFVSINEISTIAAAYALAGFATDSTHVSSNGSTLAQTGVKNAAANASLLYDISAINLVARTATPNGNGTVPQTLIHSLANSLAACINSASPSFASCTTLFSNAKSAGSSGTTATDTATAAINIAHNAGTNVTAIYNLGTGTPPFTGLGTAPSDFSIGITYTGSLSDPYSVAIDGLGNAWVVSVTGAPNGHGSITEFSPLGVPTVFPNTNGANGILNPLSIAIDQSGNAWIPSYDITKISNGVVSVITFADDINGGWYVANDKNNNMWFSTYQDTKVYNLTQTGAGVTGSPYTFTAAQTEQIAINSNGDLWGVYGNNAGLVHIANPGGSATVTPYLQTTLPDVRANSGIAIDSNNIVWAVGQSTGSSECLLRWSPVSNTITNCYADASLTGGDGVAIDGTGNVWVSQGQVAGGVGAIEFNNSGTLLSPAAGFSGGAQSYPLSLAIDGSGDVWLPGVGPSNTGTTIVELIGIAVPVVTPISPKYPGGTATGLGVRP